MSSLRVFLRPLMVASCLLLALPGAFAEGLRLPAIFADHAVLQQKAPVPVWGWGNAGDQVTVSIMQQRHDTTVGEDGRWRVDLKPMRAGGPHELKVVSGAEEEVFADILIGEVWLASGQSNMQWSIKNTENWEQVVAESANDDLRFAMVFREFSPEPLDDLRGLTPWAACNAESLKTCCNNEGFSAVSYYYAKYLQEALGVPVGIINTSWGGTRIEPWTPPEGFALVPALADIDVQVRMNTPDGPEFQGALRKAIADTEAWVPEAKQALAEGTFPPALPSIASASALNTHQSPTTLYNAMVHPLVPYANRGFIWYQGESNRGEGMLYRDKMEALIEGWRARWRQDDLACYFVQLAPYNYRNLPEALAEIWEAQTVTLDIPHTGMAVINDIGNLGDIHPRNKDDVGHRLALLALNKTYGKRGIVCEGPTFDRFRVRGNKLRVHFKHAKSLTTRDGASPNWFAICGPDGVYHDATAVIEGTWVVLTAAEVKEPVAVRFAWDHMAEPNLMNEAGLPTSAFRAGTVPVDGVLTKNVPEAKGFELLYALDPTQAETADGKVVYTVDNRAGLSGKSISRVAYFLYLTPKEGTPRWVYVEMDPFTRNLGYLGVPVAEAGCRFQQEVGKLFVKSNVDGLPSGEVARGAIESWSSSYGPQTSQGYAGASGERFDFDDTKSPQPESGYGCLQIHDLTGGATVLAYNNHRVGRDADVGIGNCSGEHPDWTFSKSAQDYESGKLFVLVKVAK